MSHAVGRVLLLLMGLAGLTGGGLAQAADCTWSGEVGAWTDAGNWLDCDGGVPGAGDTATISAGDVTLGAPTVIDGLTMSGGIIRGSSTLTVTGDMLLTGGLKTISGITLVNAGSALWDAGNIGFGPHPLPRGYFVNGENATFEIAGGVNTGSAFGSRITNHGTLRKIGPGVSEIVGTALINAGLVEVQEGRLRIAGSFGDPHTGAFEIAEDATFDVWLSHRFAPTSSVSGAGNVWFTSNSQNSTNYSYDFQEGASYDISGRTLVRCSSCSVFFIGGQAQTGELVLHGYGLGTSIAGTNNASLTVHELFHWRLGQVGRPVGGTVITEQFTIQAMGGILIDDGAAAIHMTGSVVNHGEAVYSGGQFYLRRNQARFHNLPGASFEIRGERNLDYRAGGSDVRHGRFINQGTLLKTGEGEATVTSIIIENSGLLEVQEGSLSLTRHPVLSDPWEGAWLVMDGGVVESEPPLLFQESRLYGDGVVNADVDINNAIFLGSGSDETDLEGGILEINGEVTLYDNSRLYVRLVSDDPQLGVGHTRLQLSDPTELRGNLIIHILDTFFDQLEVGDEFVIIDCAQGCTRFFEQVNVSLPPASGMFFEPLYQGNQVVIRVLEAEPGPVDPPTGLQALNNGPVYVGQPVNLTASVDPGTGSNLFWFWTFGDGASASGSHVEHVYTTAGIYEATVNAAIPGAAVSATTTVTVLEQPNFAGQVWLDTDGDGQIGPDEPFLAAVQVSADGPGGALSDSSDSDGRWRIETLIGGEYLLDVNLAGHQSTTPAPLLLPLPTDGSALADFGLVESPPVGQANIVGRAWSDSNGNGRVDAGETRFSGRVVQLRQNGAVVDSTATDSAGFYVFDGLVPGLYSVRAEAPAGHFPATLTVDDINLEAGQVHSAMLGFLPGGTISGSVRTAAGSGLSNVELVLEPESGQGPPASVVTNSGGSYSFGPLAPGDYALTLQPPAPYFPADGELGRTVALDSGGSVQEWELWRQGQLRITAQTHAQGSPVPIGGVRFDVTGPGLDGVTTSHSTGPDGAIQLDDLAPGVYRVEPDVASLPPNANITPVERTANVALNTSANLAFFLNSAQTIRAQCILGLTNTGGNFACTVRVRVLDDPQSEPVYEALVSGTHIVLGLPPGVFEVALIPADIPGQEFWPVHIENVVVSANSSHTVNYPFNPSTATSVISGFAYNDINHSGNRNCQTLSNECNDSAANGHTVRLMNENGVLLATTETAQFDSSLSGHFRFDLLELGVPVGPLQVAIDWPVGYVNVNTNPVARIYTLNTGIDPVHFGYRRVAGGSVSGRVFFDADADGSYNATIDNPAGGQTVSLRDLAGNLLDQRTTSAVGSFTFGNLLSGEYRVVLEQLPSGYSGPSERLMALPSGSVTASAQFPLTLADGKPRVMLFIDSNGDGVPQANEQRLAGVSVQFFDAPCAAAQTPVGTVSTDSSGVATWPFVLNNAVSCARLVNLPASLTNPQPNGVSILKNGSLGWMPLGTQGALTVRPFNDFNGNGTRNTGEPLVSGFSVSVNGQTLQTGPSGATFNLDPGVYEVQMMPAAGYQITPSLPLQTVITANGTHSLEVPVRFSGGIHGQARPCGGVVGWSGLEVKLTNLANQQVFQTQTAGQCGSFGCATPSFNFANLPAGSYRLELAQVPAGYLPADVPIINLSAGASVSQNLEFCPAGSISGQVYLDNNYNGKMDSGENGAGNFSLTLINDSGLPSSTVTPSNNGHFTLSGLVAGVNYALTVPGTGGGPLSLAITESPGWFSLSSQPLNFKVGLYTVPFFDGTQNRNRYHGQVYTGSNWNRMPVAGARVIAYLKSSATPAAAGCDQANPVVMGDGFTDSNGHYYVFSGPIVYGTYQCLRVVDTPGVTQNQTIIVDGFGGWPTAGGGFNLQAGNQQRDIPLVFSPGAGQIQVGQRGSGVNLDFASFRDDNANASWDEDETALGGAVLTVAGQTAASAADGVGTITGLPDGTHTLLITPPEGYRVLGPASRTLRVSGHDIELPPIAFAPTNVVTISVFEDFDGDGWQADDEHGLGSVSVQISGPVTVSETTAASGRLYLHDLPDGSYTVTVAAPAGYAQPQAMTVQVSNGASLAVPLRPTGRITGVVYADHDGDGRRGSDEPLLASEVVMNLDQTIEADLISGRFVFVNPGQGQRLVDAVWTGVAPLEVAVGAGVASAVALSQVSERTVRGSLWLDQDGDGVRRPWDTPLAGVEVELEGFGVVISDARGRFEFFDVAPGTYNLTTDLPGSLGGAVSPVLVGENRGAAVGIAAAVADRIFMNRFEVLP
ncbi:MAG: SdrD B-like domain-containing protein [Wenzhouxiangella sp.]